MEQLLTTFEFNDYIFFCLIQIYVGVWISNTRRAISRNCKHKRVETVVVTVSDRHQIEQTVISDTKPKGQIHLC